MPNRLEQQLYDLMGDDFEPFKDEEKIRVYGSVERCNAMIDSQIPPGKKLDVVGVRLVQFLSVLFAYPDSL